MIYQVPFIQFYLYFSSCLTSHTLTYKQYAQELLSTFSTALGEVSLIPATGGTFTITLLHRPASSKDSVTTTTTISPGHPESNPLAVAEVLLWDRKTDGGFPETKELKNRVRNMIEPGRDLGHLDRSLKKAAAAAAANVEPSIDSSAVTPRIENNSDGGGTRSSTVEGEVVDGATGSIIQAEKCEDCA